MTVKECYEALEGNYDGVVGRLRSEKMITKWLGKFLADPSYGLLCTSYESGDVQEAFRAAHTIKGMCLNLDLTKLQKSSSALNDALRGGSFPADASLFAQVKADYAQTADAIRKLMENA